MRRRRRIEEHGIMTAADIFLRDHKVEVSGSLLHMGNPDAEPTITFDLTRADLFLGGSGADGTLSLRNADGSTTLRLSTNSQESSATARISLDAATATATLGGSGADGVVHLRDRRGNQRIAMGAVASKRADETTVAIDGLLGAITLGGKDIDGDLYIRNGKDAVTVHITGGADVLTRPRPEAAILVDGHTGTIRCQRLMVSVDGVVTDLVARIAALEAELKALKKGGR
jgi:hypothetical protein